MILCTCCKVIWNHQGDQFKFVCICSMCGINAQNFVTKLTIQLPLKFSLKNNYEGIFGKLWKILIFTMLRFKVLYSSCLSASTANCTEVASSMCLILDQSCILHLMLRISRLDTKCFLVTVSPNCGGQCPP